MFSQVLDLFDAPLSLMPTFAATGAVLTVLYAIYWSLLPKPIPGIPYNEESANRLLGDLPNIMAIQKKGGRKRLYYTDMAKKHNAPIVQFFFGPGSNPSVVIADYREARDIVQRRSKELIRGPLNCDPWLGVVPGQFIAMEDDHPNFKSARDLVRNLMSTEFLHSVSAPASHEMVLNLIRLWRFKATMAGGLPFNADEDLSHMTYDIMEAAAFNTPPNESSTVKHLLTLQGADLSRTTWSRLAGFPKHETMPDLLQALQSIEKAAGVVLGLPMGRLYHYYNNAFNPTMRRTTKLKEAKLRYYIDQSVQRLSQDPAGFKPKSAVDHMVSREAQAAAKEGRKPSFYSEILKDGLIGYMIGGHDSTTSTLCFMVKRLSLYQEVQQKLRQNLHKAYPKLLKDSRQPSTDDIIKAQVPYLDAFIQEVLRADPPAPLTARQAACDMNILGHMVPKDTVLFFAPEGPTFTEKGFSVSEKTRSESSIKRGGLSDWAETEFAPEGFHPERWLTMGEDGEEVYDGARGPFFSFAAGKRGCWGQKLAYLELKLITTLIVWNFEFEELPAEFHEREVQDEAIFSQPKNTIVKIKSLCP